MPKKHRSYRHYSSTIRWMWSATKGFRGSIFVCCLLGLFKVGLGWCFILIAKRSVDIASGDVDGALIPTLLCMPAIVIIELIVNAAIGWLSEMRYISMENQVKERLFAHLLDSEWRGVEKHHTGDITNRMERDVSTVVSFATSTLPDVTILSFELIGSFILLWSLDQTLAWIILCVSPIFLIVAKLYAKRLHHITRQVRDCEATIQSNIQESLQHRTVLKTLEQTHSTLDRLKQAMQALVRQVRQRTILSIHTNTFISGSFAVGYVLTFGWGVIQISRQLIGYGTMVAFLQLASRVQRPIVNLSRLLPVFVRAFTSAERLQELLKLPTEQIADVPVLSGSLGVQLCDVEFSYSEGDNRQILNKLNYDFKPGSSTAILGETGVGKTTLIRLLLSLIRPTTGGIEIYDSSQTVKLDAGARQYFSYVPQGNTLLSGTIRSNLYLGNPAASEEQMWQALQYAAADFVKQFPGGLDTPCGEKGGGLSEGQAQRIAIARALLRDCPILILDEATSALDPDTEQRVIEHLINLTPKRTIIMVTHRLSAAERCAQTLRL